MDSLDAIKQKVKYLYDNNSVIHINIRMTRPKIDLKNDPAVIKGIYPHFFRIEEKSSGFVRCHTVRYTDLMSDRIEIVELK